MTAIRLARLLQFFLFWIAILLSFKSLREPDLWWMYRTGEWMLGNGVTFSDPFSYTMQGVDWFNVKWLYEIIMVVFAKIGGPEFLFVLQAGISVALLALLGRGSRQLQRQFLREENDYPSAAWLVTGFAALLVVDFRMIARPEAVSQLMTVAFAALLYQHRQQPSRRIFWLVALQALWANLHEAYGTGMVLLSGYLVASWLEYALRRKWLKEAEVPMPTQLSLAIGLSLFAVALHPRTYQMWLHPFNIFGQLQDNKFTTELASVTSFQYWQWEAYANFIFIGIAALFIALSPLLFERKEGKMRHFIGVWLRQWGLGYLAWWAMLVVLSLTAYRNIPFAILASAPIVATAFQHISQKILSRIPVILRLRYFLVLMVLIAGYFFIATEKFYQWKGSHDRYGLQVLSGHNPVGAADFVANNGLAGKRCFSDYLTSSYLLWKLQPDFKTFIDLRDLDIYSNEFFYDFAAMTQIPPVFEQKDSAYQFDYIVLFRPMFAGLHRHLIASNTYEMVFLDPVAAVYVKRKPEFQALIEQYGYQHKGRKDILTPLPACSASGLSFALSKIVNPFYQPETYADLDYNLIRGSFYQSIGELEMAMQYAEQSAKAGKEPWLGYEMVGNIYNTWAFAPGFPDSLRGDYINRAFRAYDAALAGNAQRVPALIGKALLWMQQRDFVKPIGFLKKALDIDAVNFDAHQYLAMCYKMQINSGQSSKFNIEQWIHYTEQMDRINPNNPTILLDLGLAYCQKNDCKTATAYFDRIKGVPGLPTEEVKTMERCREKCK